MKAEIDLTALLKSILTVILPPLGVLMHSGADIQFVLNIVLTLLGYFPGLVHAIYLYSTTRPRY